MRFCLTGVQGLGFSGLHVVETFILPGCERVDLRRVGMVGNRSESGALGDIGDYHPPLTTL